jgi:hypothetical protein
MACILWTPCARMQHPGSAGVEREETNNDGCLTPHPASVSLRRWAGRVPGGLVCLLCPVALAWGRQGPWGGRWAQGGALWPPQVALQRGWRRVAGDGADYQTSNARSGAGTAPQGTDACVAARPAPPHGARGGTEAHRLGREARAPRRLVSGRTLAACAAARGRAAMSPWRRGPPARPPGVGVRERQQSGAPGRACARRPRCLAVLWKRCLHETTTSRATRVAWPAA